jgi:hypothetical protein
MIPVEFISQDTDGQPVHKYVSEGREIPSVSAIIRPLVNYAGIKQEVLDNAREFGSDVHLACCLYDQDDLDPDSLDDRVAKRLNGWIKFRQEFKFEPLIIETAIAHEINGMRFGMTPDRYGNCIEGACVIEIKNTAEVEHSHQVQLAGYHHFFSDGGKVLVKRIIVNLVDDGYKILECKDRQDIRIFESLLAVTHWKWNRGMKG